MTKELGQDIDNPIFTKLCGPKIHRLILSTDNEVRSLGIALLNKKLNYHD